MKLNPLDELKFHENPILEKMKGGSRKGSRIAEYFDNELKEFLYKCVNGDFNINGQSNVNHIADLINAKLTPLGFTEVGVGSNRIVFLKNNYVYKIAMDKRGCVDNLSEYLRSIEEPDMFAKVYETNRLIAVAEYCNLISLEEFESRKGEIRDMLNYLSARYVMQDLGTTPKNYCNIGKRDNDKLVFIDYAYLYKISGNEEALRCDMCGSWIEPNADFTAYRCSNKSCAMPYLTFEILNQMHQDVDDYNDEAVVEVISADDQGTENITYIKITGEDTGEMEFISKEESEELKKKIADRAAAEEVFLNTPQDMSVFDELPSSVDKSDEPDIPKVRMSTESVPLLTFEEFTAFHTALEDAKITKPAEGQPLFIPKEDINDSSN